MKQTAYVEERGLGQGGSGRYGGPDRYVAVQVVPEGAQRLISLSPAGAQKRGIRIIQCGKGYSENQATPRSALVRARQKAQRLAARINGAADDAGDPAPIGADRSSKGDE